MKKILFTTILIVTCMLASCSLIQECIESKCIKIIINHATPTPTQPPVVISPTPTPTKTPIYFTPTPTPQPTSIYVTPTPTPDSNVLRDGVNSASEMYNGQMYGANAFLGSGIEWYLQYNGLPIIPNGYIEFTARGLQNETSVEYKALLFSMWSGQDGYDYVDSPFIFELRRYGYIEGREDATDAIKLKIKSNGVWSESGYYRKDWNPETEYRFKVAWKYSIATVSIEGQEVLSVGYDGGFTPVDPFLQVGANHLYPRQSPGSLWISDVIIGNITE